MASSNWLIAGVAFITLIVISGFGKGYLQNVPILAALILGYVFAIVTKNVEFSGITEAAWIGMPDFSLAKFNWDAIIVVVPVAIATIVEHVGSISAVSATVGENFTKDPGMHRTLLGDGVGTSLSALVGGPANTAYSSNTGVLALSRVFDPVVIRIAAIILVLLGVIPKLSAVVHSVPTAVLGGIALATFGLIAAQGIRSIVDNRVDFSKIKNQLTAGCILMLSLGGDAVPGGMATAAIVGILIYKLLPDSDKSTKKKNKEKTEVKK